MKLFFYVILRIMLLPIFMITSPLMRYKGLIGSKALRLWDWNGKDRLKAFPEKLKFVQRCIEPDKVEGAFLPKNSKRTRILSNYAEDLANMK